MVLPWLLLISTCHIFTFMITEWNMLTRHDRENMFFKEQVVFGRFVSEHDGHAISRVAHEGWRPQFRPQGSGRKTGHETLFYVVAGHGGHRSGAREWDLKPGSIFFHCGEDFDTWSRPEAPLELLIVGCTGRDSASYRRSFFDSQGDALFPRNPHRIHGILSEMFAIAKEGGAQAEAICNHYLPVLYSVIAAGLSDVQEQSSARSTFEACRNTVDRGFLGIRSMQDVAREHRISHAHLCRLFKRYAGITPHDYLMQMKMNFALHQLISTGMTVQEVAEDLGFPDPFTFSKAFKRVLGTSPSAYRRNR